MQRYTLYCTPEQTRKALELGAPIDFSSNYYDGFDTIGYSEKYKDKIYAEIPTAEQMIGWLEEQGIWEISVYKIYWTYSWTVLPLKGERSNGHDFKSRKEVTLSAIDAALEYLSKNKK